MDLLHKKTLQDLHIDAQHGGFRRVLGPLQMITLGIGAIIGAGLFVLTGNTAANNAGPGLILSMLMAATACGFAGLCYAEFASMIPVAGSAYTYAYATMGELVAWIIGWDLILEYAVSAATVAVGWSGYAVGFLANIGINVPPQFVAPPGGGMAAGGSGIFNVPAALIVLAVTALLVVGIRESAIVNTTIVIIKVAVLLVFLVVGVRYVNPDLWSPLVPANTGEFGRYGWSGLLRGAGIIFFAYIGFDAVSTAAQEAKNPQRDVAIGMLGSLAICTVLYIMVSLVLTGIVPYQQLGVANPIAVGIAATGVHWLEPVIALGAVAGLSSVMLVTLLGQSRIFFSMSRDGLLPRAFSTVHPRFRTPHKTTILTGVLVAFAAGMTDITTLGTLTSMGTLLAFVLVCVGILILRRIEPNAPRPFRTPGYPWVPVIGIVACLYLMIGLPLPTWYRLVIWLVIGLAIYFGYGFRNAVRVRATQRRAA